MAVPMTQQYTLPAHRDMHPGQWIIHTDRKRGRHVIGWLHHVSDGRATIVLFEPMRMFKAAINAGAETVKASLTEDELEDFVDRTEYLCPGFKADYTTLVNAAESNE